MDKKVAKTRTKIISIYVLSIFSVVILCYLFLYLAGLIPQAAIKENFQSSAAQIESEGVFPHVFNNDAFNSRLDNFTEAIIIMGSYYMDTAARPDSVVTNPYVRLGIDEMTTVANDESIKPDSFYIKYWMGFRSIIRPLLAVFSYGEIRTLITFMFYMMLLITTVVIATHSSILIGISFLLSIFSLNPTLIANSIQFSSCFFISFIFMIAIPALKKKGITYYALFFAICGILTQYFDFYTAPLLTLGLPLCFLLYLYQTDVTQVQEKKSALKIILLASISWFLGYGAMWLIKLRLISVFMPYNGFQVGFESFIWRVGVIKDENFMESYNALLANAKAFAALVSTTTLGIIIATIIAISTIFFIIKLAQKKLLKRWMQSSWPFFLVALFPLIWFSIAAQPTSIHYWFQYRPLGITVFCILVIYANAISIIWPSMNRRLSVSHAEQ